MDTLCNLVPVISVVALVFAVIIARWIMANSMGNDRMQEIAAAIKDGAKAFLFAEYKILVFFVIALFLLIGFGLGNWITAAAFLVGAVFSTLAGYFGMMVATSGNVRTAAAAKDFGMAKALQVA